MLLAHLRGLPTLTGYGLRSALVENVVHEQMSLEVTASEHEMRNFVDSAMINVMSFESRQGIIDVINKRMQTHSDIMYADPYGFARLDATKTAVTGGGKLSALKLFQLLEKHGIIRTKPTSD